MSAKERTPFQPRPVSTIELSDQHKTGRLVLVAILLVIAAVAFYLAIKNRGTAAAGWQTIDCLTKEANCSDEFTLLYDIGAEGANTNTEYKAVSALYSDAAVQAYRLFHSEQEFDGISNLATVNKHPNEAVTVEPALYHALETIARSGDRRIYFGPLYWQYRIIFECDVDAEAADADPNRNPELKAYAARLAKLAADPAQVNLKLLGDSKVCLETGEAYEAIVKESGVPLYLDFGRLKNALIADYIAERFSEQGLVHAVLSSKDGFARSLYTGAELESVIYSLQEDDLYPAAKLKYTAPMSLVYFRNYPAELKSGQGYLYDDGSTVTDWIGENDGLNHTALPELLCLSREKTCAELVLENEDLFTAEQFDGSALHCSAVWAEGTVLHAAGKDFTITETYSDSHKSFSVVY